MFRLRIIPSTITVATLLLCVKLMDLTHNTEALAEGEKPAAPAAAATAPATPAAAKAPDNFKPTEPSATPVPAATAAAAPPAAPAAGKDAMMAPKAPSEPAAPKDAAAKPADGAAKDAKKDDKKEEKKDEKKEGDDNPAVTAGPGTTVDRRYTPVEVELLQNLARRRDELDRWERNIMIKESTLGATEKRIDEKIMQVEAMKKEVASLLLQYNEKEDAKIRSLVKIYENMKPKDAARIFDEVEMPILLLVIDKMSEKKVAPILAFMDSKKAKSITVQLAEQRRINNKIVTAPTPAP